MPRLVNFANNPTPPYETLQVNDRENSKCPRRSKDAKQTSVTSFPTPALQEYRINLSFQLTYRLRPSSYVYPWGPFRLAHGHDDCADSPPYPCRNGDVPRHGPDVSLCPGHGPCLYLCASPCHSPARGTCPGNDPCRVFHDSCGGRRSRRAFHVDPSLGSENDENVSFYACQLSGCATCKTSSSKG